MAVDPNRRHLDRDVKRGGAGSQSRLPSALCVDPLVSVGLRLLIPRLPCGVMDMEYLHRTIRDAIENLVWITTERHCVNTGPRRRTSRTFRPARDVCDDTPDAPLDDRCNRRIMNDQPVGNCIEILERFLGIDDFHLPRNFANTAPTC